MEKLTQALPRQQALGLKVILIGFLTILSLIPLEILDGLVYERSSRRLEVQNELSRSWGGEQTLTGPFLVIPYQVTQTVAGHNQNGFNHKVQVIDQQLIITPETLGVDADLEVETRKRGIYESRLYRSEIAVAAQFKRPPDAAFGNQVSSIDRDKAHIAIGISDLRGIRTVELKAAGDLLEVSPGIGTTGASYTGLHALIKAPAEGETIDVALALGLNGSQAFKFMPVAKATKVTIDAAWPDPSFQGNFLPTGHTITDTGFTAQWDIPVIATGLPPTWTCWTNAQQQLWGMETGVSLFDPVDLYVQVDRAIKYGILFVALTFLTLFLFEAITNIRIHFVQYLMVGFALVLFFLGLLSIAEYTGFGAAYVTAAGTVVAIVSLYTLSVLGSRKRAAAVGGVMAALYAVIYSLLQMEDFALLNGTVALFVALAATMYITRNVEWYRPKPPRDPAADEAGKDAPPSTPAVPES